MIILPTITLCLIALYAYLYNKKKKSGELQSQFLVFGTLSFVTILVIISCCCTILNFIFRWIL